VLAQVIVPENRHAWDGALASLSLRRIVDVPTIAGLESLSTSPAAASASAAAAAPGSDLQRLVERLCAATRLAAGGADGDASPLPAAATVDAVRSVTRSVFAVSARDFVDVALTVHTAAGDVVSACGAAAEADAAMWWPDRTGVRGANDPGCGELQDLRCVLCSNVHDAPCGCMSRRVASRYPPR
jgi:hypothetical protein